MEARLTLVCKLYECVCVRLGSCVSGIGEDARGFKRISIFLSSIIIAIVKRQQQDITGL